MSPTQALSIPARFGVHRFRLDHGLTTVPDHVTPHGLTAARIPSPMSLPSLPPDGLDAVLDPVLDAVLDVTCAGSIE